MFMGSMQNTVYYCCVSKGGRVLYSYRGGDHEMEDLASLCLEKTPPYHKWYFQTMGKRTFGFLMEDEYVYFAITDEGLGNAGVLRFLEHVRDEFKKLVKKGSARSISSLSSLCVQEQLVPVIHRLITSLEQVSTHHTGDGNAWPVAAAETFSPLNDAGLSPSPTNEANCQIGVAASTKAPLLGKSSKQEKKKTKDHMIVMRDIELEEHRKSTDRVAKADTGIVDSAVQGGAGSIISSHKDLGLMRTRSGAINIRKKWCRQVRIILAIDAAVCLTLFVVWLIICHGTECIR
ncbi:hypothetical protein NMG60_11025623 [Bertholletia excelsa]